MTCIVAYAQDGKVWIGGDSAGVAGYSVSVRGDKKVFVNGNFIFGFTSSFRMGQILRYRFNPPNPPDWDLERHMSTTFIDEVRKVFKEYGYGAFSSTDENGDRGGTFIVGTQGRIFTIDQDFQVGWNNINFASVGCGEDVALGALYALKDYDLSPEDRITRAISAAEVFNAGVRTPVSIECL